MLPQPLLPPLALFPFIASLAWGEALDRVNYRGQELFLNGMNLAWRQFSNDIGPDPATPDLQHFDEVFALMEDNGGNALRLWLHTDGRHTPEFDGMLVTGPGDGAIKDLRAILDLAAERDVGLILCLWSFDMLRISFGSEITDRARHILTTDGGRRSYVDTALTPTVEALRGHPAIIAWEIFNEPEGMSDEFGWDFNRHVPMSDIQAFVNLCAGAIHRADPEAQVTNGSWAFRSLTDVGSGNYNYYSDERLIAAGGDPDGYLDFYTVHYYDWAGTALSPFHNPASHWALDKPVVVAEFHSRCRFCTDAPFDTLYRNGYAGALSWSWTDNPERGLRLEDMVNLAMDHPEASLPRDRVKPMARLLAPGGQSLEQGQPLHVSVEAHSATESPVSCVDILISGAVYERLDAPPFDISIPDIPSGTYRVQARPRTADGQQSTSTSRTVSVIDPGALRFEAEEAVLSEVQQADEASASGGRYVSMAASGSIAWTVGDLPEAGLYTLRIGFKLPYDSPKTQLLSVNGGTETALKFFGPLERWQELTLSAELAAEKNTVTLASSWGYTAFDYLEVVEGKTIDGAVEFLGYELWSGPELSLQYSGAPGKTYALMMSHDLQQWKESQRAQATALPFRFVEALRQEESSAFFRIEAVPSGE